MSRDRTLARSLGHTGAFVADACPRATRLSRGVVLPSSRRPVLCLIVPPLPLDPAVASLPRFASPLLSRAELVAAVQARPKMKASEQDANTFCNNMAFVIAGAPGDSLARVDGAAATAAADDVAKKLDGRGALVLINERMEASTRAAVASRWAAVIVRVSESNGVGRASSRAITPVFSCRRDDETIRRARAPKRAVGVAAAAAAAEVGVTAAASGNRPAVAAPRPAKWRRAGLSQLVGPPARRSRARPRRAPPSTSRNPPGAVRRALRLVATRLAVVASRGACLGAPSPFPPSPAAPAARSVYRAGVAGSVPTAPARRRSHCSRLR